MKAILFPSREEAESLIQDINAFVGSTAISDPVETDEGWAVLVSAVTTSEKQYNLPAMVVDKKFVPPVVTPTPDLPPLQGTL